MCVPIPEMDIELGVKSARISWWTLAKCRGAVYGILAKFQIIALIYRGTALAGLPYPQSVMLLAALRCTGKTER